MHRRAVAAILGLVLLGATPAWANAVFSGPGYRSASPVRNPQPKLDIAVAPKGGICNIRGTSRSYPRDIYGTNVRSDFVRLLRELTDAYGEPTAFVDQLAANSPWKGPNEWVHAVWRNDRVYEARWVSQPATPLKDFVNEIVLSVRATNTDIAFVTLQYRFVGYTACDRPQGVALSN